ncbi:MAG: Holliday junction resolvase [Desulfurococcales archaeon]|nr:Holliday junction resolvase [Desulfurococcales archaeon]
MNKRRIGFSRERELARILWKKGFAVIRAPASGAKARKLSYPDIVAIKNRVVLAIEVKTKEKPGTVYIDKRQVKKLLEFTRRSGGLGFIAVKIMDGRGWRFIPIEKLEVTRGGNYRVSIDTIDSGLLLKDIVRLGESITSLDKWLSS